MDFNLCSSTGKLKEEILSGVELMLDRGSGNPDTMIKKKVSNLTDRCGLKCWFRSSRNG